MNLTREGVILTFTVKPNGSIEPYDPFASMKASAERYKREAAAPVVDITGDQNAIRADKAAYLVEGYSGADDDPTSDIVDVLTDIRHLCTACDMTSTSSCCAPSSIGVLNSEETTNSVTTSKETTRTKRFERHTRKGVRTYAIQRIRSE